MGILVLMLRMLIRNRLVVVGLAIIAVFILTAVFAPWLVPYSPFEQRLEEGLNPPGIEHPFGQDKLGRDILSRVIFGARVSIWIGLVTVSVSASIGIILGSLAGYLGGMVDELLMRLIDILLAFPGILLAIGLMGVLGPSLNNVILALCIIGWVGYARLVRGQILAVRNFEFVTAAKAQAASHLRIILRHILPNIMGPLLVQITFGLAGVIVAEAGLSFLGLGTQPPTPSWGLMLNEGRQFLLVAPHLSIFPGLAIMLTVLGFNFIGDGLRDVLDPKGRRA
jgi:ABC-type dipeptide/oligopeptide/nickel transport system permease subunit